MKFRKQEIEGDTLFLWTMGISVGAIAVTCAVVVVVCAYRFLVA